MIRVSFYLLTPSAKQSSAVYASITYKGKRLRFNTGYTFETRYCNVRKKKGSKSFLKRNTSLYLEYKALLDSTSDQLSRIAFDLFREFGHVELNAVRERYDVMSGINKPQSLSVNELFDLFMSKHDSGWSDGTKKHYTSLANHLIKFEANYHPLSLGSFTSDNWNELRDDYFVQFQQFSNNTINTNLRKLKKFLAFCQKENQLNQALDLDELKFLKEVEPFKIALTDDEIRAINDLDLESNNKLEKIRDLLMLEILTGQRFSDIPKLLDPNNLEENYIQIYQQKTGERVFIPLHKELKKHLPMLIDKYSESDLQISNQKFNEYVKELCKIAGINRRHSWIIMVGNKKIHKKDYRYNLVSSHTGRRTFCTLSLKNQVPAEIIMKVTGHRKYEQFKKYVRVDDIDLEVAFNNIKFS